MQLYKTTFIRTDGIEPDTAMWAGSQTEAAKHRKEMRENYGGFKTETQTVNVPTAKGPLLDWLNENVAA